MSLLRHCGCSVPYISWRTACRCEGRLKAEQVQHFFDNVHVGAELLQRLDRTAASVAYPFRHLLNSAGSLVLSRPAGATSAAPIVAGLAVKLARVLYLLALDTAIHSFPGDAPAHDHRLNLIIRQHNSVRRVLDEALPGAGVLSRYGAKDWAYGCSAT